MYSSTLSSVLGPLVPDIAAMARRNKSRRGQLKFRGFIGTSDGVGGTDLTVILSPETFIAENQNETKSKRWLLRLNMQNELCDMITNIRTACCVTNDKSSERRNPMSRDRKKTTLRGREDSSPRSCIDESFESVRLPINAEGDRTEDRDGDEDGNGAMREIEVTLPVPQSHSGNKSKSKGIGRTVLTAVSDLLRTRHFKRSKVFDNPCDPPLQDSFSSRLYSDALTTPSASTREVKNHYRMETAIPDTTVNDCYDQRWFPKSGVGRAHVRNRMIEDVTNGDPCHRVRVDLRKPLDTDPLNSGMFHRNISKSQCREEGKMEEKEFLNYEDEVTPQFYARDDDMESPAPRGCPTSSTDVSNGTDTAGEISPCSFESPSPRWSGVGNTHSHSSESVSDSTPCSRRDSPVGMKCDTGHLTPWDVSVELFLNEAMELCDSGFRLLSIYMGSKNEYTLSTLEGSVAFDVDWQSKGSRHGVCVESSMVAGSTWQAVRAVSRMTSDKQSILQLLIDDSRMHQFDNMFDFAVPLIKVDERSALRRLCFKPVWPTAPRDFLCYTAWTELEDGSILVCSQSVPDTLLAVQKGYVRGRIVVSGYWIQPLHTLKSCDPYYNPHSSRGCKVTLAAHTELGGSLPASVINMLSTAAPLKIMAAVADLVCSDSI